LLFSKPLKAQFIATSYSIECSDIVSNMLFNLELTTI